MFYSHNFVTYITNSIYNNNDLIKAKHKYTEYPHNT